jgi:hypothetical protein
VIRRLHPFDIARYALLGSHGSGNRVRTLKSLGREVRDGVSLARVPGLTLSLQNKGAAALALTDGDGITGIVAASARSGPRTWEVSHLFLARDDDANHVNLLATLSQSVARRGGERIFARLLSEDPLVDLAMCCGFVPSGHELLYRGRRKPAAPAPPVAVRKKTAADDHGVFRLYGACTPQEARLTSGMTFGQWSASRERTRGRSQEYVLERDGEVRGWLKTIRRFGDGMMLVMVHPEEEPAAAALIHHGLERLRAHARIFCLVQDHQTLVQNAMWQRGFEVESEYVTLVRSMVTPVRLKERRDAAETASI